MKIAECVFKAKKSVRLKNGNIDTRFYLKHKTLAFCETRELGSSRIKKKMELVGRDPVE